MRAFKRVKTSHTPSAEVTDDFAAYMATNVVPDYDGFDPIAYWIDRRERTPQLARFALDMFAIPPMSVDCERSFSSGRNLLTYRRSRLIEDLIEACIYLRNRYGNPTPVAVPQTMKDDEGNVLLDTDGIPIQKDRFVPPFDEEDEIIADYNASESLFM
jgi:hypothetical protein